MKKYNLLINEMLINCVHLGHKKNLTNLLMKDFTLNLTKDITIINLEKTSNLLIKALNIIKTIIKLNKIFLIICAKKQTRKIIELAAKSINMPYINRRWLGGTLTNFRTLKSSIIKMNYNIIILKNKEKLRLKKKVIFNYKKKINKSKKYLNGIKNLSKLPDLLFIIDSNYHKTAISEAKKLKIPVICVTDTNNSPLGIDFIIPGNDDSFKSIAFYMKKITEAVNQAKLELKFKNANK